jgi:hypothetical protein
VLLHCAMPGRGRPLGGRTGFMGREGGGIRGSGKGGGGSCRPTSSPSMSLCITTTTTQASNVPVCGQA